MATDRLDEYRALASVAELRGQPYAFALARAVRALCDVAETARAVHEWQLDGSTQSYGEAQLALDDALARL